MPMTPFTHIGKHLCSTILHPIPTLHIPTELSELFQQKHLFLQMEPVDMECVQIVKRKIELLSNELSHILPKCTKIKIVDESANAKYYIRCTVNVEDCCLESCFHVLIEDNWNSCIEDCKSISHICLQCRCRKIIKKKHLFRWEV